jgi:O-antigen ligase
VLTILAALVVLYAQALTAGRMGYVTWAVTGVFLCAVRWRKYLLLIPFAALVVVVLTPGAAERMLQGFSADSVDSNPLLAAHASATLSADHDGPDAYTITAGRNVAWPYVIDKIGESPILGFGRLAMERTGVMQALWDDFAENFPHPHNAYLELLLDNGIVGFLIIAPFYLVVLSRSVRLFRDSSPLAAAVGGVASSLILALLVASFGSQTFYPREGSVGMWAAIGLMLRVSIWPGLNSDTAPAASRVPWWQS